MAIEIQYDSQLKILRVKVVGTLIPDEIASVFQQIIRSKEYPVNVDAIWDLREVNFTFVDEKLLRSIVDKRMQYKERKNIRAAFIVSTDFAFGVMRMYEALSVSQLNRELKIFKNYAEGEQWLLEHVSDNNSNFLLHENS